MTNDTSTLNGALNELGETLADNLSQMGVGDATANDGLTTLAGKILDIEPSIAGLELSTSIDCNVSSNKVLVGQQVVFSATLSASYDDTSIEDIDISGVLTGATVLFKTSDGTIIGSGVTDVNGVATYTHTIEEISNITVYSEFEGSTNFSSCISSTTVTVECSYDFDVTVDKEILSANDNDVATFNCRLSDGTGGVVGESIDYRILHNDIVLSSGSRVTGENGEITLEYAATGVGNVDVIFSLRSILQETYELEDCHLFDSGLTDKSSNYMKSTGVTMTHNTDHYILSNNSGNGFVNFIDGLDNVIFECDWSTQSNTYMNGICCSDRQTELYNFGGLMRGDNWSISVKFDNGSYHNMNEESSTTDKNKYEKLQMKIEGNNIIHTVFNENGTVIYTYSYSKAISNKYLSAFFSIANSSAYVKNIKVKAL